MARLCARFAHLSTNAPFRKTPLRLALSFQVPKINKGQKMSKYLYITAAVAMLLTNMVFASTKPQKSEYFESVGGGFPLKGKELTYSLSVNVVKPIPENVKILVEFQNPKNKKLPIVKEYEVDGNSSSYIFQSDPLTCISNNKIYKVLVKIINLETNKQISVHKQKLKFALPEFLLKDREIRSCK